MLAATAAAIAVDGGPPWAALTVWGFADAPVSWAHREHGFYESGENDFTFVVFPDGRYVRYAAMGALD